MSSARPSSFKKSGSQKGGGRTYALSELAIGLLDRILFTKEPLKTSEKKKKK